MMQAYEEDGVPVQESLMIQYLQHDEIARGFYLFYDLFRYFGNALEQQPAYTDSNTNQKMAAATANSETGPDAKTTVSTTDMGTTIAAKNAAAVFNHTSELWNMNLAHADVAQGLAAASHLMACVRHHALCWKEQAILEKELKEALASWSRKANQLTMLSQIIESRRSALKIKKEKQLIEKEEFHKEQRLIRMLEDLLLRFKKERAADQEGTVPQQARAADKLLQEAGQQTAEAKSHLLETISHSYQLLETFPGDEPLLYFTADLTGEPDCAEPLASGACPEYARHTQRLLLARQEQELLRSIRTEDGQ